MKTKKVVSKAVAIKMEKSEFAVCGRPGFGGCRKTYEMLKSAVSYQKPRHLSEEQREQARERVKKINK